MSSQNGVHTSITITENPLSSPTNEVTSPLESPNVTSLSPLRSRRRSRSPASGVHRNLSPERSRRLRRDILEDHGITIPLQPLRESDTENREPLPPIAGPEIWDTDNSNSDAGLPQPGVDDGFFAPADNGAGIDDGLLPAKPAAGGNNGQDDADGRVPDDDRHPKSDPASPDVRFNGIGPRRGSFPPFPYAPDFSPLTPEGVPRIIPDVNVYQHKKTLAQGMMDLALLSANANQLRYVLESYDRHPYYFPSLVLISISLILQIAVGVGLIWNSRYNIKNEDDICRADKINNYTVSGIFLITIVNVFISSFGVATPPSAVVTAVVAT